MGYTIKDFQNKFKELNYKWPSFHLIGIRSKNYIPNEFCDTFVLFNGGQLSWFKGTTRPGSYYLLHLLNPKGTAILKDRKSTRLNSSHVSESRMPSSA